MDTLSLYYFKELTKDMHMARTAERLFISHQTLSNHIKRLENHFGTPLFYRKPQLSLTYAGEMVLDFAKTIAEQEECLNNLMADVKHQECGSIRFGASRLRLDTCLPHILPLYSAQYPKVEISIMDTTSAQLEPMVEDGSLDYAILLESEENPHLVQKPLMKDQIYLCVSDKLLRSCYGSQAESLKERALNGTKVDSFSHLPFCMYGSRMGKLIQKCFDAVYIKPKIYISNSYSQISIDLCFKGVSAAFATQMTLASMKDRIPDDINIFPLYYKNEPLVQSLYLVRLRDRRLTKYGEAFLNLLFDFFSETERMPMTRKAEASEALRER